jgi:hypothetical protein
VIVELVVLLEGGPRVCKELVVSVTFTLSFCSSFLLFRLFGGVDFYSEDSHVVQCVCGERRVEDVQRGTVFGMYWGLKCFGQDVCGVVGGGHSPDSHLSLHVILLDFVVANVDRAGVFGVVRLGGYMFSRLVVRIKMVYVLGIAKKFEDFSDMFACLISPT